MKIIALIMAGGVGERFWPASRRDYPKQFLCLTGDKRTMIQKTVDRILPVVAAKDIYIVTDKRYRETTLEQLPMLPKENIILEPAGRNTAPCICLGASIINRKYDDCVIIVLPADHLIKDEEEFRNILKSACELADKGEDVVTLGIRPSYPETGYGYIKVGSSISAKNALMVERFVEKPNKENAEKFLDEGCYLWNSGMFIWKLSLINSLMERYLPDIYEAIVGAEDDSSLATNYEGLRSISIDYGILEKIHNIQVFPSAFGWDDVGSWPAVARINEADSNGNVIMGNVVTLDSKNCIIQSDGRLIMVAGVDNLVVVEQDDVVMVCHKDYCSNMRNITGEIEKSGNSQVL